MAQNKKALLRYKVYDACFRNRTRRYNREKLIDTVNEKLAEYGLEGIAKSQFYKDLEYMETCEWQAPIETYRVQGRTVYFRYADPNFSINNMPLTDTDLNHLQAAFEVFESFSGLPQFDFIDDLILALEEKVTIISTRQSSQKTILDYETNVDYIGNKFIKSFFNAVSNKQVVEFEYQPFNLESIAAKHIFHPMYLKQYNTRWFILGYNHGDFDKVIIYALDRIKSENITILPELPYYENDYIWSEYLEDRIGLTMPFNNDYTEYNVEIWINPLQSKYIVSKPLHHSQKSSKQDDGSYIFKYKLLINFELERFILGLGEACKVLAPAILKDRIKAKIKSAMQHYE